MDQCFAIDNLGFILKRQAGGLTVCGDEEIHTHKKDIKGLLKSQVV